jgi:hypothetical protein
VTSAAFLLALGLAFVFATTAARHVLEPWRIRGALSTAGIREDLAPVVTGTEAALVPLLVLSPRLGGALAVAYLGVVTAALAIAVAAGRQIEDCGCTRKPHRVDGAYFGRNAALLALGAVVGVFGSPGYPFAGLGVAGVVAAIAVTRFAGARRAHG